MAAYSCCHLRLALIISIPASTYSSNNTPPRWSTKETSLQLPLDILYTLLAIIVCGVILYVFYIWYLKHYKRQKQATGSQGDIAMQGRNDFFTFQAIAQATENFAERNKLGSGAFADVYRGLLQNRLIAVKKIKVVKDGYCEFDTEIDALTKVKHRNIVDLLGYCVHNDDRLLVYEYMPQGTLSSHLFSWRNKGYQPLTWEQRLFIAFDMAKGLEYMHTFARQTSSYIHRDIKSSNILLGDQMEAKIGDFGLVKRARNKDPVQTEKVMGTYGYIAPEYASGRNVTVKIDVYAFGIILMELITGLRALDHQRPQDEIHLGLWMKKLETLLQNVDTTLDSSSVKTQQSTMEVAKLALLCTKHKPNQRPDMTRALGILGPIVGEWRPTSYHVEVEDEESDYQQDHLSLPQRLQIGDGSSSSTWG